MKQFIIKIYTINKITIAQMKYRFVQIKLIYKS